jgi:DNA-binding transcriptional MerR regulator
MTKRVHKLAEVCKLLDLQPYVLRYWETEFPSLQEGSDGRASSRGYSREEVDLLRRIKRLLYEEGYTIAGAKKKLEVEPGAPEARLFDEPAADGAGAAAAAPTESSAEAAAPLDSAARERIETLERGVAEALEEAQALLALLDSKRR